MHWADGAMADTVDELTRSRLMARIRAKDTAPERLVRTMVFAMGYRYRLHVRALPGTPDLVFPGRRKIIFVHGCFWHLHPACAMARLPKSRTDFWRAKLQGNRARDAAAVHALTLAGWRVLTLWECELGARGLLAARIAAFLGPPGGAAKARVACF